MKPLLVLFCLGGVASAQPNCSLTTVRCVGAGQEYTAIQQAAAVATPGDIVYVYDGQYAGFSLSTGHVSGTITQPITFKAQSPNVIINVPANTIGDGISISGVSYVVVDGFTITGMSRAGIFLAESDGSLIQNNNIRVSKTFGILTGFAYQGIIQYNTVDTVTEQHGIYVGNSARAYDGPVIRGNRITNTTGSGIQINGDCQTKDSLGRTDGVINGYVIEGNFIHDTKAHAIMLIDASSGIIRNNVGYSTTSTTVQTGTQDTCNHGSDNNVFVNNTFDTATNAFRFVQPSTGNVVFNNVMVTDDKRGCVNDVDGQVCPADGRDGIYFSGNKLFTVAQGMTGVFSNYAAHDYYPAAGSPLLNTAWVSWMTGRAPAVDILGNIRPVDGFDFGAYEYGSTLAPIDVTAPTAPGTPTYTTSASSVMLTYGNSTDDREVLGYYIYRDGSIYAGSLATTFIDTAVTPGTTHTYAIAAFDDNGNISPLSGSVSVTIPGTAGCLNSTTAMQRRILPTQSGSFTVEMDVTPFGNTTTQNGVVGLSPGPPTGYYDLAAIVVFNSSGIQARNGDTYSADSPMTWLSGVPNHIRFVVDTAAHRYSVYIRPLGASERALATNYAFRTEQASAKAINYLGLLSEVGVNAVCNVSLGGTSLDSMTLVSTVTPDGTPGTALISTIGGYGTRVVTSVAGRTGDVVLGVDDTVGLAAVLGGKQPLLPYIPEQVLSVTSPLVRTGNVISCPLCGAAPMRSGAVTFVKADSITMGAWKGVYGGDGYEIAGDTAQLPAYGSINSVGYQEQVWEKNTSDGRALQKAGNGRIAVAWYTPTSMAIELNLVDGRSHRVSLYMVDWENSSRMQQITITDLDGNVLDTRPIANFSNGQYLVWNISGRVVVRVTNSGTTTAVVSGIFFE